MDLSLWWRRGSSHCHVACSTLRSAIERHAGRRRIEDERGRKENRGVLHEYLRWRCAAPEELGTRQAGEPAGNGHPGASGRVEGDAADRGQSGTTEAYRRIRASTSLSLAGGVHDEISRMSNSQIGDPQIAIGVDRQIDRRAQRIAG